MALDLETIHRIHSGYGYHYEIGTDPDTDENVEIRYIEEPTKMRENPNKTIVVTFDALPALIESLQIHYEQLKKKGRR